MTAVTPPSVWPMPCASLALSLTSDRHDRPRPADWLTIGIQVPYSMSKPLIEPTFNGFCRTRPHRLAATRPRQDQPATQLKLTFGLG